MDDCIFCKIVKGEIPSFKVFEDDKILAFEDINPISEGHTLIIPKRHAQNLYEIQGEDLIAIHLASQKVAQAIKKAMKICKRPTIINYLSDNEPDDQEELLSLVSNSDASLVIRASKGTIPTSLEGKLQIIEDLLEMANEADIPNERLFADPSIVHIGSGMGQRHLLNSYECVKVIKDLVQPPLNTIAWIANVSSGLPKTVRKPLEATFLSYMAGAGLDAAMVDVLDKNIRRTLYLIKSFRDEIIFTKTEMT